MTGDKLRVQLEQLQTTSANWMTISQSLDSLVAPHVPSSVWPSAVATGALHSAAQGVNEQYSARIAATAGGLSGAASAFAAGDTAASSALKGVKDVMDVFTGPAKDLGGMASSAFKDVTSSITGALGPVSSAIGQVGQTTTQMISQLLEHTSGSSSPTSTLDTVNEPWPPDDAGKMLDDWKEKQ